MDSRSTTRAPARRRPQRHRVGPRGAAPLARRRAQVAAPLRQGCRGRQRLRSRRRRSGRAARRAGADPPGRRCARAGRPAGAGDRAARQRDRGAAQHRQAASADARAGRRHREVVVRAARLPRRACSPARPSRRCRCSRSTAPCRRRSRPTASTRPTCGRWTGAGASTPNDAEVVAPRARRRRALAARGPSAAAHARHPGAHRGGAHERRGRRPGRRLAPIRRCAPSGTWPPRCSRRRTTACCRSTSSPSGSPRACCRSSASCSAAIPTSPSGSPATCSSSAPRPASPRRGLRAPRLDAVREAYGLPEQTPDRLLAERARPLRPGADRPGQEARRRRPRKPGPATAGGEMHRMAGLSEQFALVGDSLRKLFPYGETFAAELQTRRRADPAGQRRAAAAAGDGSRDQPALHRGRARRRRLRRPRAGATVSAASPSASPRCARPAPPEPLEAWMEELYRRVSDRQTMGSVVQELRASLAEAEKAIDQFFRNPADRGVLVAGAAPARVHARRAVGARHGPGLAGAAAHARRGRGRWSRPQVDPARTPRPACSIAWPATSARSAS